jgi:hypothetical protein
MEKKATIYLSKTMTVIEDVSNSKMGKIYTDKLSNFKEIISKYNEIKLNTTNTEKVFEKYNKNLLDNGFKKYKTNWFRKDYPAKGAVDVEIIYKK